MSGSQATTRTNLRYSPITASKLQHLLPEVETEQDRLATLELGGPASNVFFVQHGQYAAQAQKLLGKAVVDANYPMDHTHTAPFLADVVCRMLPFLTPTFTDLSTA